MNPIDWVVLVGALVAMVAYGVWKGKRSRDLDGYLLGGQQTRWFTVALAIMATQASAITFLSTPGQAYVDGMRFVQFYFGLPLAMIVLSITAVPLYRRLKVYTAYEYLESRFDLKVRTLAATLFLIQRGLACGLTIYAPALVVSVLLGWSLAWTVLVIGVLVTIYTASGGTRAVNYTSSWQMVVILLGMVSVLVIIFMMLPHGVTPGEAALVAGRLGRLNAIDLSFDLENRYNIWSGLIGGFFLALAYFGTDQSQVGRYISGQSVTHSRLGLLANGLVKVPMQFFILFIGAMVFAFYQFNPPPVFFNSVAVQRVLAGPEAERFRGIEATYQGAAIERRERALGMLEARRRGDGAAESVATAALLAADDRTREIRGEAVELIRNSGPLADGNDTNYIFLRFVLDFLPVGMIGLVLACVFAASMSSTAGELNALASTTVVDLYRRRIRPEASESHYVAVSIGATAFWGALAVLFAEFAGRLGSLVEAVNILGSLFYGTILGIFLLAFYVKRVGGNAAFLGAVIGEAAVVACFTLTKVTFLWYNVVGCLVTVAAAILLAPLIDGRRRDSTRTAAITRS